MQISCSNCGAMLFVDDAQLTLPALGGSEMLVQIAACNCLHEVDQRLGRWLLMSQDR